MPEQNDEEQRLRNVLDNTVAKIDELRMRGRFDLADVARGVLADHGFEVRLARLPKLSPEARERADAISGAMKLRDWLKEDKTRTIWPT